MPGPGSRYSGQAYYTPGAAHKHKAGDVVKLQMPYRRISHFGKKKLKYANQIGVIVGVNTNPGGGSGNNRWSKYWVLMENDGLLFPVLGYFITPMPDTPVPSRCKDWEEYVRPQDYEPKPIKISRKEENKVLAQLEPWAFEIDWEDSDYPVPLRTHHSYRKQKPQLIASSTMALVAIKKEYHRVYAGDDTPAAEKLMIFRIRHARYYNAFHLDNQTYYVAVYPIYRPDKRTAYWYHCYGDLKNVVQKMKADLIDPEYVEELTLKLGGNELATIDALLL